MIPALDFYSFSREELEEYLSRNFEEKSFRAAQLFEWIYWRGVSDPDQMSNISKAFREKLKSCLQLLSPEVRARQVSTDGSIKLLLSFPDGAAVETVLVAQPERKTLCVSSQIGCAMDCRFCRTATMGLVRNLSTAEILSQVLAARKETGTEGDAFSNIVFMGMGEPLANLKSVTRALKILIDGKGLRMAPRKITVSTSGLVPAIRIFGRENPGVNLAVSLNATSEEVRSRLMPINKKHSLSELLACLRDYPLKKRDKLTIEYVLIAGVNDTDSDLQRLPGLLHGIACKINLIPYNDAAGMGYKSPTEDKVNYWQRDLNRRGFDVMTRWSKGADIKAACGQLAVEKEQKLSAITETSAID